MATFADMMLSFLTESKNFVWLVVLFSSICIMFLLSLFDACTAALVDQIGLNLVEKQDYMFFHCIIRHNHVLDNLHEFLSVGDDLLLHLYQNALFGFI